MSARDIVIWEHLDQGLVHLNRHIPLWKTGYLMLEAQTLAAFVNRASTIVVVLCLALIARDMLDWRCRFDATMGR